MKYEINNKSFNEQVYQIIKEKIIRNEFKPGEKLNVVNISEELGVSRTPVSNAMQSLERDGYVVILPQNGTYVKELTYEELDTIYRFRAVIEGLIIEMAIGKIDREKLKQYLAKFNAYSDAEIFDEKTLKEFYSLELDLHSFLVSYCPEVVRKEIQNIIDLTRRSRFLNLEYELKTKSSDYFKENELKIHIALIQAILDSDIKQARKLAENDVLGTKNSVLEFMFNKEQA